MTTQQYTYLLGNPNSISQPELEELTAVLARYPYFQSAHALYLKGLKESESYLYNDALKLTAAHTTDRNILFEYITSKTFSQHKISQLILQHDPSVLAIEVSHEDISAQTSLAIDEQLKAEREKADAILNPDLFLRKKESIKELAISDKKEQKSKTPEEELELDKPLKFTKKDTYSFGEWLKLSKAVPIERQEETNDTPQEDTSKTREEKFKLIEKFIQDTPKLEPTDTGKKNKNLAKPFTQAPESLMTETLAKVYMQQKNYKKAIQAYKILILKNPEKSGFFADQIRAIKKLTNKE